MPGSPNNAWISALCIAEIETYYREGPEHSRPDLSDQIEGDTDKLSGTKLEEGRWTRNREREGEKQRERESER